MNTLFANILERMRKERAILFGQAETLELEINERERKREIIAAEIAGMDWCIAVLDVEAEKAQQPARKPKLNITQAVADYLDRQDGPRSVAGIARAVGRKPSQVKAALNRLAAMDRAAMLATDEGEKWLAPTLLAEAAE